MDAIISKTLRLPQRAIPALEAGESRFFFIWRIGGSRPRQRHATAAAARAELDRLRIDAPEGSYKLFEAVEVQAELAQLEVGA